VSANARLHIGIIGAGAIGGYVGARLAANGATEVTLIGRKALADAIAKHGLTLREFDHEDHVDAAMVRIEQDPHGTAAPINRRIAELVHEAERASAGSPQMSADTLLAMLRFSSVQQRRPSRSER
jgi:ketopantoate reductase